MQNHKRQNQRIDADLLVKIEIRRNIDADERMSGDPKDFNITYYVSEELRDVDGGVHIMIAGQLSRALYEVLHNRW